MTVLTAALVGCSGEPTGPTRLIEEEEGPRLTDFYVMVVERSTTDREFRDCIIGATVAIVGGGPGTGQRVTQGECDFWGIGPGGVAFSDLPAGGFVTLHAEAVGYHPVLVNVELVRGLRLFEIAMTRIH
jgi:hypothetical protein